MKKIRLKLVNLYRQSAEKKALALELGRVEGEYIWFTEDQLRQINPNHPALKPSVPPPQIILTNGPGTELKKILKKIGIVPKPNCTCNARAAEMNRRGVEWCEKNINTIVGWLREEAQKRKLPFSDTVAKLIVRKAISRAAPITRNPRE